MTESSVEIGWPETLVLLEKLQDGWCGPSSTAFSPRQLLLAHVLLSIATVYGLHAELTFSIPAEVHVIVFSGGGNGHAIYIPKASESQPFVPEEWPGVLHDWAQTCVDLTKEAE